MESRIYAAIDANINRSLEGIRVCEDVFRFIIRNEDISLKLKEIRHKIVTAVKNISINNLLNGRDVEEDSIKFKDLKSETKRENARELIASNLHRAMEAMRSIEEFYKLLPRKSEKNSFQEIRFILYELEKDMIFFLQKEKKLAKFDQSLYAILDSSFVPRKNYIETAKRLIDGGASIIQLRMKNSSMREIQNEAEKISLLCKKNDALFIVNDYPEIANLSDAGGLHLGQDDLPASAVRKLLPLEMIIGISTHSLEQAIDALEEKPDYLAIGPIHETQSKSGETLPGIGSEIVRDLKLKTNIPIVSIGGLNPERISVLKEYCSCFAVISYLFRDNEIEKNCKNIMDNL